MRREVREVIARAAVPAVAVALAVAGAAAAAPPPSRADRPEYTVTLAGDGPGQVRPYLPLLLTVELTARGGFHVNDEYPTSFRVTPSDTSGLRYPRSRIDAASEIGTLPCQADATRRCGLRLIVPFFVEKTGSYSVGGTLRFSVCDEERCLIEKVELARTVVAR